MYIRTTGKVRMRLRRSRRKRQLLSGIVRELINGYRGCRKGKYCAVETGNNVHTILFSKNIGAF